MENNFFKTMIYNVRKKKTNTEGVSVTKKIQTL